MFKPNSRARQAHFWLLDSAATSQILFVVLTWRTECTPSPSCVGNLISFASARIWSWWASRWPALIASLGWVGIGRSTVWRLYIVHSTTALSQLFLSQIGEKFLCPNWLGLSSSVGYLHLLLVLLADLYVPKECWRWGSLTRLWFCLRKLFLLRCAFKSMAIN